MLVLKTTKFVKEFDKEASGIINNYEKQLAEFIQEYDYEIKELDSAKEMLVEGFKTKLDIPTYQNEIEYLVASESRNKFIVNLALTQKGTTLVLFNYVEKQGKVLYKMAQERSNGKTIMYISGEIGTDEREKIRLSMDKEENVVLFASVQTCATGINIPSIENIIFASSTKSKIRNLQSIGRGLRLKEGKSGCNLYDIADDLSYKKSINHTLKHFSERVKIYSTEQFDLKLYNIKLK